MVEVIDQLALTITK